MRHAVATRLRSLLRGARVRMATSSLPAAGAPKTAVLDVL
jgi:hypothetical protein